MSYNGGLENNSYYVSIRHKVNVCTLQSPPYDSSKCLFFNLDQKYQNIVATAWHNQNIYYDPSRTVICPSKGKIKWSIQKPYLPPPLSEEEEEKGKRMD